MYKKKLLSLLVLTSIYTIHGKQTFGKTFFNQRSQQSDTARYLVGWPQQINICDMDCVYGSLAITPEYSRNFNRDQLGSMFFYNGTNTMLFGPSNGPGVDVFSRNFFLNDQFTGSVSAFGGIQNFIADFTLYLGLDEWTPGLFFTLDAPINWTNWNLHLEETVDTIGENIAAFALGNLIPAASPIKSIITAYAGQTLLTTNFLDLKQTLQYGRVEGKQTKTRIADLELAVGYNFICCEDKQVGVSFRAIFPTGNRPDAVFLFEPIVGNGHHYEVGLGINGNYQFWQSWNSLFTVFLEARVYHMFQTQQRRIFDLKNNGIGSNRLLLKRFSDPTTYAGEIIFGPNVLARDCRVRNDLHADASVMFDVLWSDFNFEVGYNFWARTRDKISHIEDIPLNTYAVSGITGGATSLNPNVNRTGSTGTTIKGNGATPDATNVFLTTLDLDVTSAQSPTALSHAVFYHFGYTWQECEYSPFLGIGGKVEFSGRDNNALDQWGIWTKFGFSFN